MQDLVGPALGTVALVAIGGYLLGSVPFGVILTRVVTGEDVRSIGSGNIGATNVLRTGRKDLAFATLILDAGKGAAAYLIVHALFPGVPALAAIAGGAAFLGHLSSFAALVAAVMAPLYALLPLPVMGLPASGPVLGLAIATAVLIWIRHHENIARILKGTEPRIGAKKT